MTTDIELSQDIIDKAKAEGALTFYSGTPPESQVADAFEAKYGIPVEFVQLADAEMTQRFIAESDGETYVADILQTSALAVLSANADLFRPMSADELPNFAKIAGSNADLTTGYLQVGFPLGISYNTNLVAEADVPKTWTDVLDPKFAGSVCLTDPRQSVNNSAFIKSLIAEADANYLEKFAAQLSRINSTTGVSEDVSSGACSLGMLSFPSPTFMQLVNAGAPMKWTVLEGPALQSAGFITISANAPHPNAALLFANFALSLEAAKAYCTGQTAVYSIDPTGSQGCFVQPEGMHQTDLTVTTEETDSYLATLGQS
jgi:iron(III) transport system substrate-binding protein